MADTYPMAMRARILVAVAAALTAVYFVLPANAVAEAIRVVAPLIGVGAVWFGMAAHQPRRVLAWVLVAMSLGLLVISQLLWARLYFGGSDTFPSAGDAFHLVSAIILMVALAMLGQDASPDEDTLGPIETAIVGIAVGLGVWLAVVEPYLADRGLAFGDRVWAVLVPLIDALALAIAFRTATQNRFRVPATTLLAIGVAWLLVSDVARGIAELRGSLGAGGFIAALAIAPPMIIGAAALDPTMTHRNRPHETVPILGFGRVVWLECRRADAVDDTADPQRDGPRHQGDAHDLGGVRRGGRDPGPDPYVASRGDRAGADRTQGPGSAGGHGRTLQRRRAARRRKRRDELREPRSREHARASTERLDRQVPRRSRGERRPWRCGGRTSQGGHDPVWRNGQVRGQPRPRRRPTPAGGGHDRQPAGRRRC